MHEIFLTTIILGKELDFYLRVLQGVCIMQPNHIFQRRIMFEGPRTRPFKAIDPEFIKSQGQKAPLYQNLHEQLSRQSFYLTAIWDVEKEAFGKKGDEESGAMDCSTLPGMLRWADLPDPPNARKVNSRHIIHIENEKNLCEFMKLPNYKLWAENFRECYQFVNKNVVIEFGRFLRSPNHKSNPITHIDSRLPPFEDLEVFDAGEDKWVVTAYLLVGNGTDQELMKEGVEELRAFKNLMEGSLDFEEMDRHDMDPRVR